MNNNKPVQLSQKIDYLFEKVTRVHSEIKKNYDLQFRLNFQQFIDSCIRSIIAIKDISSPIKNINNQNSKIVDKTKQGNKQQYYSLQTQKLNLQKKIVKHQIKQLEIKQLQIDNQYQKIKYINKQKQVEDLKIQKSNQKKQYIRQINKINQKYQHLEQQIEKLIKINHSLQSQIKLLKDQRKRAENNYFILQQKYNHDLSKLQKFQQKKPKYLDRNTQGLKCIRYFTNTSSSKNSQKLIFLKLPVTIEVNKLIYGIMIGVQLCNSKQIGYYDKFQLYQKQQAHITMESQYLIVKYKKRKENQRIVLDKYGVRSSQIVVMLFGKGDSIIIHDQPINEK